MVLLKEALKARVAAYKEAIEEATEAAVEAAANAVAETLPGEPGGPGKPVVRATIRAHMLPLRRRLR